MCSEPFYNLYNNSMSILHNVANELCLRYFYAFYIAYPNINYIRKLTNEISGKSTFLTEIC